jgi:hypothetical protein
VSVAPNLPLGVKVRPLGVSVALGVGVDPWVAAELLVSLGLLLCQPVCV